MSAAQYNARYRRLVGGGATVLSAGFDLPTQLGYDSDHPDAAGEVGRAGVAVDSLDDMRVLFGGVPLEAVSLYLTADGPAALLLLLYQLVAEEQGVEGERLRGTVRNDILTEYIVRGRGLFPLVPSLRLTADLFAYCRAELPRWRPLSLTGHRLVRAGASPVQEAAFVLSHGIEYVRTAEGAGLDVEEFASRLTFRSGRRVWARVMKERFGVRWPGVPGAWLPRFLVGDGIDAGIGGLLDRVEALGGAAAGIELGFQRHEIGWEGGILGAATVPGDQFRGGSAVVLRQRERLAKVRAWRHGQRVDGALGAVRAAAGGTGNVLYPLKDALAAGATVGEACGALREVWGECLAPNPPDEYRISFTGPPAREPAPKEPYSAPG
ncbi:methylmalonyl-CoA mutase family protein [Streptomyces sp. NPDC047000]|uniref:methylmalonyl-CoA mutase family protein n=1 Tax=Streptomyces sp. NPDC047000 TaxID=3155474 RepID=UPI00340F7D09